MSLFIASINSGSNGNCYYVGTATDAILVDAGISCRETEMRMKRIGLSMHSVRAIFVSHEHTDHIRGVAQISRKYQLPVYITPATMHHSRLHIDSHLVKSFTGFQAINIGALSVTAFPKFHDAIDPHSFIVAGAGTTIGVFTDIGTTCQHLISHFKMCHAAFLEANYDDDMLQNGKYPHHLKKRISGDKGHLSNFQALTLFMEHRPPFMTHLILSHLSKDNNHPDIALKLFSNVAGSTEIVVASRYEATAVYEIIGSLRLSVPKPKKVHHAPKAVQISLF